MMMCRILKIISISPEVKTMSELFDQMMSSCYELIATARSMMESCRQKRNKRKSDSRLVISMFLNRSIELFESFLVLLKNNRLADSAILLRSFWEMGINTSYIFSDIKLKEINALKFLINEEKEKTNLLRRNLEEFKKYDCNIEKRLKELEQQKIVMVDFFNKKYKTSDLKWPKIIDRAEKTKDRVVKKAYDQIYCYLCSIEHHDMSFGRNYIDEKTDEPLEHIKTPPLLRPELNIIMARSILLVIMKTFDKEYCLKWEGVLKKLEVKHGKEYEEMKQKDEKASS